MWVTKSILGLGGGFMEMFKRVIHSFVGFLHMLSLPTLRSEQGVYVFSTVKLCGYYDYLYIYKSRCETNLSLHWGAL